MAFFPAVKGTTSGTPGTGNFTPNAAVSGFRAWSTVPAGQACFVRYEDGTSWELQFSWWDGTALSRATGQFFDSSSGSALSLTSSATAAYVMSVHNLEPNDASIRFGGCSPNSTYSGNFLTVTILGTSGGFTPASTNLSTELVCRLSTSATTANAQAGLTWGTTACAFAGSAACRGGWAKNFTFSFATAMPTGPRIFSGMTDTTFSGSTGEPSALGGNYAIIGKDSTDTNFQLMLRDNATTAKTDLGFAPAINKLYRYYLWSNPGSLTVFCLLINYTDGNIAYATSSTHAPIAGAALFPVEISGLSGTTGTAIIQRSGQMNLSSGP